MVALILLILAGSSALDQDCPNSDTPTYIADPTNCSIYYECIRGSKFELFCPAGLLWNDETKYCDNSEYVDCDDSASTDPLCPSSTETINVVYPDDCSKYYKCVKGQKQLETCPENMYFNPTTSECDYMDNVNCANKPSSVTSTSSTSTQASPTVPTLSPGTTSIDPICPSTTENYNVIYPYDCSKYYKCIGGQSHLNDCPENMLFNPETNGCDYMDKVTCSISTSHTSASSTITTSTQTSISSTASPDNPSSIDPICPSATEIYNVIYPYDCSKYYKCIRGQSQLNDCPENMFFNPDTSICDYEDKVTCGISTSHTSASSTITNTPSSPDPICSSVTETYNVVYPYDCSKYYKCISGQSHLTDCPENMLFNPDTSGCDYTDQVKCDISTSPTSASSTTTTTRTSTSRPATTTTTPIPTTTQGPDNVCSGKPDGTYIGDPTNCRKFFECVNGKGSSFTCPKETIWDQVVLSCINSDSDC